jgi:hypothetical protein
MPGFLIRNRAMLIVLVVSALIAAVCAKLNSGGDLVVGGASAHVLIDDPAPSIVDRMALNQDVSTLQKRAELYGRMMTTPPVIADIAKHVGVPASQISGLSRLTAGVPHTLLQARSEQRASQIAASLVPYRLELQASPNEPVLNIYAVAPSAPDAERLANSAVLGLDDYLRQLAVEQHFPVADLPQLRQLGSARGAITNGGARVVIAGFTFFVAFALVYLGLLCLLRRPWRPRELTPEPPTRLTGSAAADWPRTSRALPWSVAGLIAMFWLTPFDKIQLAVSAPVNLTLDRLVLPLVAAVWLIATTAGPGAKPRFRLTRVHVAVGLFLACAFVSVVVDARYLNQTGDLMVSLKKLPLLLSYVSIFLIVASSVRRTEVPAFLKYSLWLGVICAIEIIYEYHFKQNLFNQWFAKLPHPFEFVADSSGSAVDSLGRRWVEGPGGSGVDAITMLTMVLPVALLGVMTAHKRKPRIFYGVATAILLAAMVATQRKSALVAPAFCFLTLAYFRRRELLKLAPVGLVIMVMIPAVSPGAIHGVISQFTRSGSTTVATVSDRTSDYDAVRPDLWSHLLIGRGYGSFDPATFRILDSEILSPLVEVGVLGLTAYLMIGVSLVLACRKLATQRDPLWSPVAIVGVSAGVCVLICSMLYDFLGFPHGTVVFLYIAGLITAVIGNPEPGERIAPLRRRDHHELNARPRRRRHHRTREAVEAV